ncbi:MAG: ATP phosphoribosyltransferase regulatory subunit, partial [Clostridia bacterium]
RNDLSGRSDECTQAGIELLGASGLMADLEVIVTAVEALKACDINFRLEIGHANIFRLLAEKLDVDENKKEQIRTTIESKNYAQINDIMKEVETSVYSEAIKKLPRLFGGEEVFVQAEEFCTDNELTETLLYLKTLYTALCKLGLGDKITIDLGLVQRNDYYSGMVFSAYTQGQGSAILLGGRYDNLLEKFSCPMPAVGFAMEVDAITEILLPQEELPKSDVIVFAVKGREIDAQIKISELTQKGYICESSFLNSPEETKAFAKEHKISKMIILDNGEKEVFL